MNPDIFESASFSFQIQKFTRPHVAYSNRIRPSTGIQRYPDSIQYPGLLFNKMSSEHVPQSTRQRHQICCVVAVVPPHWFMFSKRLDTILPRHRIRKYPDSHVHTLLDLLCINFCYTPESRFKNIRICCRIHQMRRGWTEAISRKKNLRIEEYLDTCGWGISSCEIKA